MIRYVFVIIEPLGYARKKRQGKLVAKKKRTGVMSYKQDYYDASSCMLKVFVALFIFIFLLHILVFVTPKALCPAFVFLL